MCLVAGGSQALMHSMEMDSCRVECGVVLYTYDRKKKINNPLIDDPVAGSFYIVDDG